MALFDGIKEKITIRPTLRICMMGPRAVGKTTVMTSIFGESQEKISETALYLRSEDVSTSKLLTYRNLLANAIAKGDAANLPATGEISDFLFGIGLVGRNATVNIQVKDFPGEYLNSKKDEVNSFVAEATVVLVAVDTPYLMEEEGRYNEEKNNPQLVKEYFKNNAHQIQNKLILFVPLKCERYFHDGRIGEVTNKVREIYGDYEMVKFFRENNIASSIVSIQTLGGMEFEKMEDAEKTIGSIPKIARYRIYEDMPRYQPLYCSQPLYYLLAYVAKYYEWSQKQDSGFLKKIQNSVSSWLKNDEAFYKEIAKMNKFIIRHEDGFVTITSNSMFNI